MMTTELSHDMSISGGMDYYLIQIKLGHAGDFTTCPFQVGWIII